ncbi:transglycosylase domain-containing protein [Halobacteriovorax sp. DPLXC-1]|uniref:transglycosylase domain-containing protein n=1 Tax=Halobacteriovorax sp. DPLXC-1 TaxID=3110771 RepID=UPI002FF424E9
MLLKRLKILLLLSVPFVALCVIFVVKTINDADLSQVISGKLSEHEQKSVIFEEGSFIVKDEFLFFKANSNDERFTSVFKNKFENFNERILSINETFELKALRNNNCHYNRCLQYKIPFYNIPIILSKGLIGIEDFRFLDHIGIDYISILRAIVADIKAGALVQGGSTLTQQLVKNIYFTNEKSFSRKIKEAILAVYIDFKFEKSDILEAYFNEVFWGSLGGVRVKGVHTAAVLYFNKPISELDPYESAILVSMLKGPGYYHPIYRTERLKGRANFIFNKLQDLNLFDSNESYQWSDEKWDRWRQGLKDFQEKGFYEAIYLTTTRKNKDKDLNEYRFFKTVVASKGLLEDLKKIEENLAVKISFGPKDKETFYYSKFERNVEKALLEERHGVGSTLKPVLYQIYLQHGYKIDDLVSTEPVTLDLISGVWTPSESHTPDASEYPISQALQESLNNPIVRLARDIGFEKVEEDLKSRIADIKTPLSEYPAQLLGAVELSVHELHQVYRDFLEKECEQGSQVYEALADPRKTTIRRMVKPALRDQHFFGKTGTSNNGFDNLFVGYDGHDLFTIWVGYEGSRANKKGLRLYGSTTAFRLYQEIILYSGQRIASLACE